MTSHLPQPDGKALSERTLPVDLSIIMPCFNEAESIEKVLREWQELLEEEAIAYEIIVVNDGSSDGTGRLLDRIRRENKTIKVIHQLNSGADRATRRGYEMARGKWVLHAEASGRFEPLDFLRLWEKRETSPFVIAHRTHRLDSFLRRTLSKILRWQLRRSFNLRLIDPNVSFRLVRRDIAVVAIKEIPANAHSLNLWMDVILCKMITTAIPEVAVPYRKRITHRVRRKRETLFRQSRNIFRDLMAMKYGNGTQPGLGKLVISTETASA